MNIFVLDAIPQVAASMHCDRHVVKMILEYGQMLSTAHRLHDATSIVVVDDKNRKKPKKFWLFGDEHVHLTANLDEKGKLVHKWIVSNSKMYQVAHVNHPCSVWARKTDANYRWLFMLFEALLCEYTHRYSKEHSANRLKDVLRLAPTKIARGQQTPFAQTMPEEYKHVDTVEAYHRFYVGAKSRFAKWTNRDLPQWFERSMEGQDVSVFKRTRTVG